VGRVQLSNPIGLFQIERANLNHYLIVNFPVLGRGVVPKRRSLVYVGVQIHLFVDSSRNEVKERNDITRKVLQLLIQLLVKLPNVVAVNLKYVLF
jgi:hypothetical protein